MPNELLTTSQVAALFQVHPRRVRQWIEAGQMKAVRTPGGRGTWRVHRAEVNRLLGITPSSDGGSE